MASLDRRFSSAAVLIENEQGELLIVKAGYKDHWSLPGGIVDTGESPLEAAVREQRRVDVEARAQYMLEREALRGARGARRAKAVGLLALGVMAGAAVVSLFAMRIIGGMA